MGLVIGQRLVIRNAMNACHMNAWLAQQPAQGRTRGWPSMEAFMRCWAGPLSV